MKGMHGRYIFILLYLFLAILVIWVENTNNDDDIGYLSLKAGESSVYFEKYNMTFSGDDIDGATYFLLPSYIKLSELDYSKSELKVFREDGTILQKPNINSVENVLVGGENEELIPYRVGFFCSENLYTIEIELPDQGIDEISQDVYSQAIIRVVTPDGRIKYSSKESLIKGRGNMTWRYEKKPYDIKLKKKLSIAGMGASEKWTLLADNLDPIHLRNRIAFDVAEIMDMEYVTESDWVDLYINSQYMGNYLICHEISDAPGGGILLEQNASTPKKGRYKWGLPSGMTITIKSPDSDKLTDIEKDSIMRFTFLVDDEITNHLPEAQYGIIDRDSFVRRYLVDEITLNADHDFSSHFYYKKPGAEKLYAGPCWDFDKSLGYDLPGRRDWNATVLSIPPTFIWWDLKLTSDKEYHECVRQTFENYYNALDKLLFLRIDEYYDTIRASLDMDRIKWSRGPERMFENSQNDMKYLKYFLNRRLHYMAKCYGVSPGFYKEDLSDNSLHNITLKIENGAERVFTVKDGTLLKEEDLPEYDKNIYSGWVFDFDGRYERITGYIPVYEDLDVILEVK